MVQRVVQRLCCCSLCMGRCQRGFRCSSSLAVPPRLLQAKVCRWISRDMGIGLRQSTATDSRWLGLALQGGRVLRA